MNKQTIFIFLAFFFIFLSCGKNNRNNNIETSLFPHELVDFVPYENNPVFSGTGKDTWDKKIRERGFILYEDSLFKMWYTGYNEDKADTTRYLGYAISKNGLNWQRYSDKPIYDENWTEDVHVVKVDGMYYMVAEGLNDIAFMLKSKDGIKWHREGKLDIRKVNGEPINPGPYGTPTLWIEKGKWYLFYERNDQAVWLAVSTDQKVWINVQDEPVLKRGPETYDKEGLAIDQIIKYKDKYYAYYHGTPDPRWDVWNSNIAVSDDLIHWKKYEKNPIIRPNSVHKNFSSPILVYDGNQYRLYTMHDSVRVYFSNRRK